MAEATVPSSTVTLLRAAQPAVLSYALEYRRWERGLFWLMAITCAAAFATLPAMSFSSWMLIRHYLFPIPPAAVPAPGWTLEQMCGFLGDAVFSNCLALLGLVGIIVFDLCVMVFDRGRKLLIASAWLFALSIVLGMLIDVGGRVYLAYHFRSFSAVIEYFKQLLPSSVGDLAVQTYPAMLLALVLRSSKARVVVIWWLTVVACIMMAIPIMHGWYFEFDKQRDDAIGNMFLVGRWYQLSPLLAIGSMAGGLACFAIIAATIWTLLHGPKGRAALLVCASLLVVRAFCLPGVAIFRDAVELYTRSRGPLAAAGPIWNQWEFAEFLRQIGNLGTLMAFALAIRVALSLSDVRAKLDRLPAPAPA